jgi:methylmalonyl-CoA/ethylmalonyl-CoA epimerase
MSDADVCTVNYIDHVGIAVNDIDAALKFFGDVFQTPPAAVEELADQGVRATLIQVGETRLELLEPLSPESAVGRFIERRGEGLHHLALNVDDIEGKLAILAGRGIQLVDEKPREGLSGSIAFIHPRSVFGVLTELVESVDP